MASLATLKHWLGNMFVEARTGTIPAPPLKEGEEGDDETGHKNAVPPDPNMMPLKKFDRRYINHDSGIPVGQALKS